MFSEIDQWPFTSASLDLSPGARPIPPLAAAYPGPERRDSPRVPTLLEGKILSGDGAISADCVVVDLSLKGARVRVPRATALPPPVALLLTGERLLFDAVVAWRRGDETGLVLRGCSDLDGHVRSTRRRIQDFWADLAGGAAKS